MSIAQKLMTVTADGEDTFWLSNLDYGFSTKPYAVFLAGDGKDVISVTSTTVLTNKDSQATSRFAEDGTIGTTYNAYPNQSVLANGVALDSSGEIYDLTRYSGNSNPTRDVVRKRSDVSSTPSVEKRIGPTSYPPQFVVKDIAIGDADSVILAGTTDDVHGNDSAYLISLSGSTLSTIDFEVASTTSGTNNGSFFKVATDGSGNCYGLGKNTFNATVGTKDCYLAKFNSAGVVQWQRNVGRSSTPVVPIDFTVSDSGDIYIFAWWDAGQYFLVFNLNSSGSLQWTRLLRTTDIYAVRDGGGITIGKDGKVIVAMNTWGAVSNGFIKYQVLASLEPSTGATNWANAWTSTSNNATGIFNLATNEYGSLLFSMDAYNSDTGYPYWVMKLPSDGSGTGTYSTFTYGSVALTNSSTTGGTATVSLSYGAYTALKGSYSPSTTTTSVSQTIYSVV